MKKYLVEFTYLDGKKETVEFGTERLEWSIKEYYRNRFIASHQLVEENVTPSKKMLFG
jgi:hypothetical protein